MKSPLWVRVLLLLAVAAGAAWFGGSGPDSRPAPTLKPIAQRNLLPDFSWPDLSGSRWSRADHPGEVVILNFWATWCGPCREEIPELVRIANRYRGSVSVLGVNMDARPKTEVPPFAARVGINYPVLIPAADSAISNAVETIPTTLLIDRHGRVALTRVGAISERELAPLLDRLLAEPRPE